jgi:hypothetical protein
MARASLLTIHNVLPSIGLPAAPQKNRQAKHAFRVRFGSSSCEMQAFFFCQLFRLVRVAIQLGTIYFLAQ